MALVKYVFGGDDDITSFSTNVRKAIVKEHTFAPITRLVHAGDGPYAGEGKTWSEKTKLEYGPELMKVFRMVRGNHDCKNSEKAQTQIDIGEAFGFPTTGNWLWAEQVGNSYIIGMDSEDLDIEFERDQKKFVAAEIAKAKALRASGQIDWLIVVVHKPWFTLKSTASPYTAVRRIYNDMFLDAQVDFMFFGHNHNWQGWYPMEVDFTEEANGLGKQLFELMPDGKTFDFSKRHGWQGTVTGSSGHEWNEIDDSGEGVKNVMKYIDEGLFVYTSLELEGKFAKLFAKDTDNKVLFEAHFSREGGVIVPPECPPGQHKDPQTGQCVPDVIIPPVTGNNYKFESKFGSKGTGDGQFIDPHDVTFDVDGNLYIPDRERNDIQVFTHTGQFIRKFGGPGSGEGQFNVPYSVQTGPGDTIFVCDRENSRIQKLSKDGTFLQQWTEMNGKKLNMPEDLAFDVSKQFLFFTDTENNRIIKCTKDMEFVLEWGSKGDGDDQFDHPHGIDVGPDGNVYVNSGFQPYIKKFTPEGKFIKKWGSEGTGEGQFLMFLEHLDVDDRTGKVFIINNNVRPYVFIFDPEGKYLGKFGSEKEGSADGEFNEPEHVTIDHQGKAYCVDSGNFRIQIFAPEGTVPDECSDPAKCKDPATGICRPLAANEHKSPTDGTCQKNVDPGCPAGQCKDPTTNQCRILKPKEHIENGFCVPDIVSTPEPNCTCPTGWKFDKATHSCIKDISPHPCPKDYHWNEKKQTCVPDPKPPFKKCGPNEHWDFSLDKCVLDTIENKPPIADAGVDKEVAPKTTVTLNGTKSSDPEGVMLKFFQWRQLAGPAVTLTNADTLIASFVAPDITTPLETLSFEFQVTDDRALTDTDTVIITVKKDALPPCPAGQHRDPVTGQCVPDTPTGDALWDSDVDLKTGEAYTITDTYGSQEPGGRGVFMAASGDPRLIVDPDGTFHLEADSGHGRVYIKARNYNSKMVGELMFEDDAIRNTTLRLRSRHNEGGDCEQRFGGFGVTVEREEQLAETSTERCHNEHSNTVKNPLEKHIEVGAWIKFEYSCWSNADKSAINQKLQYDYGDGQFVTVIEETFTEVEPHFMDEAKFMEESYAWLRVNNESTGKVAYRHVKILKL